ncbi:MAG: flagellar protein FlaG [Wenzhouxiangella sp.]
MDNSISMTRVQPASPPKVESAPRQQPAASPPDLEGLSSSSPNVSLSDVIPDAVDPEALEARLEKVREQISEFSRQSGRDLEFQVQQDSGRVVILVKSSETGEVLRAIPPEEAQRMSEALAAGEPAALVDQRA